VNAADGATLSPDRPAMEAQTQLVSGPVDLSDAETQDGGVPPASGSELTEFLSPPQAADELGRLGPYRILKVLGHGGMGVVYQAEDPQLRRLLALKAMLPALSARASARQRFLREARAAAAIEHDNIVAIFQVGEDRGVPYLAMPFLRGEPLDERLKREGRLPLAEALRIARETAQGLAAAHKRGLMHRDIKPANLWLEEESGRVRILDFGLARSVGGENQLTQQGAIVGTPAYMAPEQAAGQEIDARCDLFSLGCVLYRMCTGKAPFSGRDSVSTLVAVATETPLTPRQVDANIPEVVSRYIMQMLAKSPDGRPASAQAVVDELRRLEAAQSQDGMSSPPPAPVAAITVKRPPLATPPQPERPRRRRTLVLGAGIGLLAALACTIAFWQPWRADPLPKGGGPNVPTKFPPACIILWMGGGPSQFETFDPKPNVSILPAIDTSVPGVQYSGSLPHLAKLAHHMAIVRTLSHREGDHVRATYLMHTGHPQHEVIDQPPLGCILGKELGRPGTPGFVLLSGSAKDRLGSGFLGPEFRPLLVVPGKVPTVHDCEGLAGGEAESLRKLMLQAFDMTDIDPAIVRSYGAHPFGRKCLLARRMIEVGVPVVEINHSGWDTHADIAASGEKTWTPLDEGWSALLRDLETSGRLSSTLIVWMGEFGRTPSINANKGRDHWPQGFSVVLAGGLVKNGIVVGQNSDNGRVMLKRPVSPEELYATIYSALGIDPHKTNIGPNNVRVPLVEKGYHPVKELLHSPP
jgi:serine/threonine protein kinase